MSFPDNFPDVVTVIEPGVASDRRGDEILDYAGGATTTPNVGAWMQEYRKSETTGDRDVRTTTFRTFLIFPTLDSLARIEWNGQTYDVDSDPTHVKTPRGYHHTEALLKLVEG